MPTMDELEAHWLREAESWTPRQALEYAANLIDASHEFSKATKERFAAGIANALAQLP